MRISDWSSDVCSSDLAHQDATEDMRDDILRTGETLDAEAAVEFCHQEATEDHAAHRADAEVERGAGKRHQILQGIADRCAEGDRKSVVSGESGSVRVDIGGRRIRKTKKSPRRRDDNDQHKLK